MERNNLSLKFGDVRINIKWVPEGWLVMMRVKSSNISLDVIPDKKHLWKPKKEDWLNISIFGINKSKAVKTPEGWLIYVINKPKIKLSIDYRHPVTVSTKYIHDPENIFNPDETVKRDSSAKKIDLEGGTDKRTVSDLIKDNKAKAPKPTPTEGYDIRVETSSYGGTDNSPVKAKTLEELIDILKNKYHKHSFTLISKPLAFESSGSVYNKRRDIPIEELNDADCQWLAENSSYDVRHLE